MMLNDAETGTSVAESRSVNRSLADVVLDMRQLRYRVPARQWSYCPQPDDGLKDFKEVENHTGGLACHNGSRIKFGREWRHGGVVGVAVDVDRRRVYFSYNGNWRGNPSRNQALGLAFDNISFSGWLRPAATICGLCGQEVS